MYQGSNAEVKFISDNRNTKYGFNITVRFLVQEETQELVLRHDPDGTQSSGIGVGCTSSFSDAVTGNGQHY